MWTEFQESDIVLTFEVCNLRHLKEKFTLDNEGKVKGGRGGGAGVWNEGRCKGSWYGTAMSTGSCAHSGWIGWKKKIQWISLRETYFQAKTNFWERFWSIILYNFSTKYLGMYRTVTDFDQGRPWSVETWIFLWLDHTTFKNSRKLSRNVESTRFWLEHF